MTPLPYPRERVVISPGEIEEFTGDEGRRRDIEMEEELKTQQS